MSLKVVGYLSGIPSSHLKHKSHNKLEILKNFIAGVNLCNDEGILNDKRILIPCDVGVIQGWVHNQSPNTPHLLLRRQVADNNVNRHTIIADSNLFNYQVGKDHHMNYLRFSLNGIFPTTGNYFDGIVDPSRWVKIQNDLNIHLKEWRSKGEHILICCQRNGGWSMKGMPVIQWIDRTVKTLRQYTDRPIIIRAHPGDKKSHLYLRNTKHFISKKEKIIEDFNNAWAVVTYNSSPGVAAAIEGIPVFVTDPKANDSQAFPVANIDLANIENPKTFARKDWIEKLAMSHWNFNDLKSGVAWQHMRKFL